MPRTKAAPKPVRRKKPTAKKRSTSAPKRIIKRKATTRAPKKVAAVKPSREVSIKAKLAEQSKQTADLKALTKNGTSIEDAAAGLGIPLSRARRLLRAGNVKSGDRVVGTDREVGKAISKMRADGVPWPEVRARTGLSGSKVRSLFEDATGTSVSTGRAPKAPKAKPTARSKKTTATKAKAKATARAPRTRKAKAAPEAVDASASGRPMGRRARKMMAKAQLSDVVWNLDSKIKDVRAAMEGKSIEVSINMDGRKIRPMEYDVATVQDISDHAKHGRVIHFLDTDHRSHYVSSREITDLKSK